MAATPNTFDYFNRGEMLPVGAGTSPTASFDYFLRKEPFLAAEVITSSFSHISTGGLTLTGLASYKNSVITSSTGGLAFTGLATASGAGSFSHSTTGGLTFTGLATTTQVVIYSTSSTGGLTLTGLTSQQISGNYNPTGGLTFTGLADISAVGSFSHSSTGGLTFTGLSSYKNSVITSSTGGLTFTGSASYKNSVITVSTGGLAFTGLADISAIGSFSHSTTGGLTFTGLASYKNSVITSSTGGFTFTGLATASGAGSFSHSTTGGLTFTGLASVFVNFVVNATGSLSFTGISQQRVSVSTVAIGSLIFGGLADITTANAFYHGASGSLSVSGIVANFVGIPTSLTVAPFNYRMLRLSWTAATNSPTGYKIERSDTGTSGWVQISDTINTVSDNGTLQPDTTYYYRVRAYNDYGDGSYSSVVSNTTWFSNKNTYWADDLNSTSTSSSYTTYGGTWSQSGGIVNQTSLVTADPKKYYYNGSQYSDNFQMVAKVRSNTGSILDERFGVSISTNTVGEGINLVFRGDNSAGGNTLWILDDHIAWMNAVTFNWYTNNWYWFKFAKVGGVYYGRVWEDGTDEPSNNSWTISQNSNTRTDGYVGFNGGSLNVVNASFDDLIIQDYFSADININANGSLGFSGSATVDFSQAFNPTSTGGLNFTGLATTDYQSYYFVNSSGSLVLSGLSTTNYRPSYLVFGSNGLAFTGIASVVNTYSYLAAGQLSFTGTAAPEQGIVYDASGGFTFKDPYLVALYRFDEGTGTSTTADSSGNGYNGTLINSPTWTYGSNRIKFSNTYALDFNGSNQCVDISAINDVVLYPSYPDITPTSDFSFSISLWFKTTANGVIFGQTGVGRIPAIQIDSSGNISESLFFHIGLTQNTTSGTNYADGFWHHVVAVYDQGVDSLYVDGVLIQSQTLLEFIYANSYNYYIGCADIAYPFFNGSVDDVRIYRRPLSSSEVTVLNGGEQLFNGSLSFATATVQASSGVTLSGSATCVLNNFGSTSGGLTLTGSATTTQTSKYSVVGFSGLTFTGLASYSNNSVLTSIGILTLTGLASASTGLTIIATSGLTLSGNASAIQNFVHIASGSISFKDPYLIALYRFDEGTGTSTTADSSGNGYTATLVNSPTWGSGSTKIKFDDPYSLTFNGSSQYVDITIVNNAIGYPTSGSTNNFSFSISLWFKTTTSGVIFGQAGSPGYIPAIYIDTSNNIRETLFYHSNVSVIMNVTSGTNYADNNWHHVVGIYDQGVDSLYVDGVFVSSQTVPELSYNSAYNYYIGAGQNATWPGAGNQYFSGNIDDVRIYKRSLTVGEISTLSNGIELYNASVSFGNAISSNGNLTLSGSATVVFGIAVNATGGLTLSGQASYVNSIVIQSTGGLTFTGLASTSTSLTVFATDGLTLSGSASTIQNFTYDASGSISFKDPYLIALYRFDEGTGTSTTADSSGNGYNATLVNSPTWSSGSTKIKFDDNYSLDFNGINQYVDITVANNAIGYPSYPDITPTSDFSFSISLWFKTTTSGVIFGQTGAGYIPAIYLDSSGNIHENLFFHNGLTQNVTSGTNYADNNWHHVVGIYDQGVDSLYVDGVLIQSQTLIEYRYDYSYNYFIGYGSNAGWPSAGNTYFTGSIDDVRIYKRPLSSSEVTVLNGGENLFNGSLSFATANVQASNGVTLSGSAKVVFGISVNGTSGLTFTGLASYKNSVVVSSVGGLTFTGLASTSTTLITSATGGLTFTGLASTSTTLITSATGGLTFTGLALVSTSTNLSVFGTEGLSFTGSALVLSSIAVDATGSIVINGSAKSTQAFIITDNSGNLVLSGTATVTATAVTSYVYIASGRLVFSGLLNRSNYQPIVGGNLAFSGTTTISLYENWIYLASGNLVLRGNALTSKFIPNIAGFGDIALSGKAEVTFIPAVQSTGALNLKGLASITLIPAVIAIDRIKITGLATTVSTSNFNFTDGFALSGQSTIRRSLALETAGNVAISGSATATTSPLIVVTGRVVISGLSTVKTAYITTTSGNVSISGSSTALLDAAFLHQGTGSLSVLGSAKVDLRFVGNTTGNVSFTGVSQTVVTVRTASTGKINLTGQSDIVNTVKTLATGRIALSGTATCLVSGIYISTGSIVISGAGKVSSGFIFVASGNLSVSGISDASKGYVVSATGQLGLSGQHTLSSYLQYLYGGSGRLVISGQISSTGTVYFPNYISSGQLRLSGINRPEANYSYESSGQLFNITSGATETTYSALPLADPGFGTARVLDRSCTELTKQDFFHLLSPTQKAHSLLKSLGFSRWKLICFDKKTREGTILIDDYQLAVVKVPAFDALSNIDNQYPIPTDIINRAALGVYGDHQDLMPTIVVNPVKRPPVTYEPLINRAALGVYGERQEDMPAIVVNPVKRDPVVYSQLTGRYNVGATIDRLASVIPEITVNPVVHAPVIYEPLTNRFGVGESGSARVIPKPPPVVVNPVKNPPVKYMPLTNRYGARTI